MSNFDLIPYTPTTSSFEILYPNNFHIEEDDSGIVTITSPLSYSSLTLSGYNANSNIDEKVLTEFFQNITEDYTSVSELTKKITKERLYLECAFEKDNINWVWWAVAEVNQIIMISANSETVLTRDDYYLYCYIIDEMKIYPSIFED